MPFVHMGKAERMVHRNIKPTIFWLWAPLAVS